MTVIVAPQACTDGVYVVKPVILAHGKCDSDVGKRLSHCKIMECAHNDDCNICGHSTHLDSLRPLLQCMHYMNKDYEPQSWYPPPHDCSFAWRCWNIWIAQLPLM